MSEFDKNIHIHYGPSQDEAQHTELHREADSLGKYALELRLYSDEGMLKQNVKEFVNEFMRTSASECFNHGADLIGHIKSFVKVGDKSILFSMVDDRIPTNIQDQVQVMMFSEAELVLHVIVHGIWDDTVRECTLRILPEIAQKWGIKYDVLADHTSDSRHHCQ